MTARSTSTARPSTKSAHKATAKPVAKAARTWSYEACKESISEFKLSPRAKNIVAFIANLITIGSSYYVGMTVTIALATMVAGLTGSMFVTFMVLFLGQVLAIIGSIIAGAKVHLWVINDSYKTVLAAPGKFANWASSKAAPAPTKKPARARA